MRIFKLKQLRQPVIYQIHSYILLTSIFLVKLKCSFSSPVCFLILILIFVAFEVRTVSSGRSSS